MRRCGLKHKLPKNFPYRKESVRDTFHISLFTFSTFSRLKHPVIVVPRHKFMVLNLKCMSIYNIIEHAMVHVFFVVEINKKMSLSQRKEKKREEQQQINSIPLE